MLKIIFFCAMFIFALSFNRTASAAAYENYVPTISVNGEGIVEVSPDCATISVGVVSRNKDATKVQADNARIATNIINSIIALDIERKNIRTGNYNFRQVNRYDENGNSIFDGYEVTNTVTIFVSDLNKVGKVIDASLSNGANQINSLNFGIRDKEKFQNEALRLAVRDALNKAEIAAAGLGKKIVSVCNVSINSTSLNSPVMKTMMARGMNDSYDTPIESGTLNCSASVHVEFEISR